MSILALALATAACVPAPVAPQRFTCGGLHMGTWVRIVLWTDDRAQADQVGAAALRRVAALDALLDDRSPRSELSRLSASAGQGAPRRVGSDLWQVLRVAQDLALETDGAFDVTVGPVVRLWRESRERGAPPDPARLRAAMGAVGHRHLVLDPAHQTAALLVPGMRLDLGGIAKGYAAQCALLECRRLGVGRALVAIGGDIAAGEPPPGEVGWRIGLPPADPDGGTPEECLLLARGAVSTSGDQVQHLDVGGRRHSHVVDPHTGMGVTHRATVTVVVSGTNNDGVLADGLASALSALGPGRASLEILRSFPGAAARIVSADGAVSCSASFPRERVVPRVGALRPDRASSRAPDTRP